MFTSLSISQITEPAFKIVALTLFKLSLMSWHWGPHVAVQLA